MLRLKYLNSKGGSKTTNKAAVAPSSSSRLRNLKKSVTCTDCAPDMKLVPDRSQADYITEKRVRQHICNGNTRVAPEPRTCANNKVCDVTKDLSIPSQGNYIENSVPGKCSLVQHKKPMVKNNVC